MRHILRISTLIYGALLITYRVLMFTSLGYSTTFQTVLSFIIYSILLLSPCFLLFTALLINRKPLIWIGLIYSGFMGLIHALVEIFTYYDATIQTTQLAFVIMFLPVFAYLLLLLGMILSLFRKGNLLILISSIIIVIFYSSQLYSVYQVSPFETEALQRFFTAYCVSFIFYAFLVSLMSLTLFRKTRKI